MGSDVLVIVLFGSGKMLGFLLFVIEVVLKDYRENLNVGKKRFGASVVFVVVSTRELIL